MGHESLERTSLHSESCNKSIAKQHRSGSEILSNADWHPVVLEKPGCLTAIPRATREAKSLFLQFVLQDLYFFFNGLFFFLFGLVFFPFPEQLSGWTWTIFFICLCQYLAQTGLTWPGKPSYITAVYLVHIPYKQVLRM